MPWKETRPVTERMRFWVALSDGALSMAELCRQFGISRKTGYKWRERLAEGGGRCPEDRSRAPHRRPQALAAALAEELRAVRVAHPTWGPRKVRASLLRADPARVLPAASTIGALFTRAGLTVHRRRRRHAPPRPGALRPYAAPNAVWCADFKGQFRTGDGALCYPLTLTDGYSRYLLRCQALPTPDGAYAQPIFEAAFREYGLPQVIRTDNGPPFASTGLGGLSRLAVWWMTLGIVPERIDPGKPAQNGRHERMHRTLKHETANPPHANLRAQQRAFDAFRQEYNDERPHEALGQVPPGAVYEPSPQAYRGQSSTLVNPDTDAARQVRHNGEIKWHGQRIYVNQALAGEAVGLTASGPKRWLVTFGPLTLGILDEQRGRILEPNRCNNGPVPMLEKSEDL